MDTFNTMRSRAGVHVVAVLLLCLALAACGSTVQVGLTAGTQPGATEVAAADGMAVAPPAEAGAAPVAGGSAPQGTAPAGGGGGVAAPAAGTAPAGHTGTAGPAAPEAGGGGTGNGGGGAGNGGGGAGAGGAPAQQPGGARDTTPVRLGFIILKNGEAFVGGMGTEVSFGNGRRHVEAIVDDLNARGGIAGRKIEPFYAEYDAAAVDTEANYLAACTKLAEDDKVAAILTPINVVESVVACAAKYRVPLINASFDPGDDHAYAQFGDYFFSPSLLSLDNSVRLMLQTLRKRGELGANTKVGIMYRTKSPHYKRVVDRVYVPLLESWGIPYELYGVKDYSQDVSAAQLRFSTTDVNLVMFMAPNGINQLLFMQSAEQQGYRPKYFTTDSDSTRFVSANAPRAQARNIAGVGTLPISNVPADQYPPSPQEAACLKLIRENTGENTANRVSSITATLYCELVYTFAAVAERVNGPLTVDAWRAAYPSVGTSYKPISTFGIDFGNGRHDNATLYRPFAWSDDCGCLTYTGRARPVPRA